MTSEDRTQDSILLCEGEQINVEKLGLSQADLVDLVAQTVIDRIEEQKCSGAFLDQVVLRIQSWQPEIQGEAVDPILLKTFFPAEDEPYEVSIPDPPASVKENTRRSLFHRYEDDDFSGLRTKLLVSSFKRGPRDGGVFELDFGANTYRQVLHCDGRGLARYGNGYIVASRDQGLFVLDKQLNVVVNYPVPPLDLHGVTIGPDGLLYLVETRHNRVGIYRMNPFERVDEIVVSPDAEDRNHVNDLCFRGGSLLLSMFSAHGFWRDNLKSMVFDGAIVEYDVREKKALHTIASGLKMPHTLKLVEGDLCYCESFGLNVVRSGEKIGQYFGYTRGLAHDGQFFYVGQSRLRHHFRHLELTLSSDAGVHILAAQKHLSRFVSLPTPDVYGILVME